MCTYKCDSICMASLYKHMGNKYSNFNSKVSIKCVKDHVPFFMSKKMQPKSILNTRSVLFFEKPHPKIKEL